MEEAINRTIALKGFLRSRKTYAEPAEIKLSLANVSATFALVTDNNSRTRRGNERLANKAEPGVVGGRRIFDSAGATV